MIQHGSGYKILDRIGSLPGEDVCILDNSAKLTKIRDKIRENLTKAHVKASKAYNLRSRPVQSYDGQIIFR